MVEDERPQTRHKVESQGQVEVDVKQFADLMILVFVAPTSCHRFVTVWMEKKLIYCQTLENRAMSEGTSDLYNSLNDGGFG